MKEPEQKVWGTTICEVDTQHYARHRLTLLTGSWCSFHHHAQRANRFRVINGLVRIVESYGWRVRCSTIGAGMTSQVPSLVAHQFQVIEAGEMIEEYWPDRGGSVYNGDIERLTEGGIGDIDFVRSARGVIISPNVATTHNLRLSAIDA